MTAWLLSFDSGTSSRHCDVLFFQSADRSWVLIGCIDQGGPAHGIGGFATFFHLKTTF